MSYNPVLKENISQKSTSMNSMQVKTNSYYTKQDTQTFQAEEVTKFGENVISLSSSAYGGSSQVILPTTSIVQRLFLELDLPAIGIAGDGVVSLPQAWGYAAIDNIRVVCGASNETIYMGSEMMLQMAQCQCESLEKLDHVLTFAGNPQTTKAAANTEFGDWQNYKQTAVIDLSFLWMTMRTSSAGCNKGLPCDLLSSPIQLTIQFKRLDQFVSYETGVVAELVPLGTGFSRAQIFMRGSFFTDNSFSLKQELQTPGNFYAIPLYHAISGGIHSFPVQRISATNKLGNNRVQITLNGMLNSDLIAVLFHVVPLRSIVKEALIPLNPLNYAKVRDVQLIFNGQTIFNAVGGSDRLISQFTSNKSGSIGFSFKPLIAAAGTNVVSVSNDFLLKNMVQIDLSRTSWSQCGEYLENTVRYLNSSLNLSFNVVQEVNTADAVNYRCFVTYIYPGTLKLSQGVSSFEVL